MPLIVLAALSNGVAPASGGRRRRRDRVGAFAVVSAGVVAETWERMRAGALMQRIAVACQTLVVAVIAAGSSPRRRNTLWLVVVASAYASPRDGPRVRAGAIAQHGYARLLLPIPVVALAAHAPRRWAAAGAAVLAALLVVVGFWVIPARTTEHEEYRWLRGQLEKIPAGCYVAHVSRAANRSLFLPVYPPRFPLSFDNGQALDVRVVEQGRCVVYVHGSICTSAEGRPACEAFERSLDLEIAARTTWPAAPSFDSLPYDRDTVECWVARVRGPRR